MSFSSSPIGPSASSPRAPSARTVSHSTVSTSNVRRKAKALLVSAGLGAVVTLLHTEPAKADTIIGVQGNINSLTQPSRDGAGVGVDVLLGKRLNLALITLGTELSLGAHSFVGADDATAYRALVGANLGVGTILRPSVFAHIGVGHIAVADNAVPDQSRTGLAGDVGLALDFTLLPLLDIGVQGSYNAIRGTSTTDPFRWLQGGVHATLVF